VPIWMVCRASYINGRFCSCERLILEASFEVSGIALSVGHLSCAAMFALSSDEAHVVPYRIVIFGPDAIF
jgi:hypothetical protein